tara:strand:- start:1612 stop:1851 length:240 start_codon:yes stop_codon:yes gene_type:complete
MINEGDIKIGARIVLTEIPVDICFYIEPGKWLFSDKEARCEIVWKELRKSHPLTAKIAMHNTKLYKYSTWIENIKILSQ